MIGRNLLAASAALCAAGCTLGPDFLRPDAPKAETYLPDTKTELIAAGIPGGEAQTLVQSFDIPGVFRKLREQPHFNGAQ